MRQAIKDVVAFHLASGFKLSDGPPAIPDELVLRLAMKLLNDEFGETMDGLIAGNLPKIADGLADVIWVSHWIALACGIDLVPVWEAVREANMTKVGPNQRRDPATGKILKPDGFVHPDVEAIIDAQPPLALTYGDDG